LITIVYQSHLFNQKYPFF